MVVWASDDQVSECKSCRKEFTVIRRKHHCRACGDIFCNQCSSQQHSLPHLGYPAPVRVYISHNRKLLEMIQNFAIFYSMFVGGTNNN